MKAIVRSIALALIPIVTHAATIALNPQVGYRLLGVSCGGIHTSTYVTGFDLNGNITGEVYAWTRCGLSGRGGGYHSNLYTSWHSIVWDLTGTALVTLPYDGVVPDPAFTAADSSGDTISTTPIMSSYGPAYLGILETP